MGVDYSTLSDSDLEMALANSGSRLSFFQGSDLGTQAMGEYNAISRELSKRTPANQAWESGKAAANSAVSAAQSGVNAVLAGRTNIDANLGLLRQNAADATAAAKGMGADIAAVRGQAGLVNGAADALLPYADKLGGLGDQLFANGSALYDEAKDVFGQGGALVRMDPSAGGLASQFINYWNSLSPDRYVSQAASDTQASYQNAFDQSARDLSRRGVSAGSGAYGALERQKNMLMATALAAAKTKARQAGLDQQAAQLDKMVAAANTMYNMGNQTANQALAAQNAGAGLQKDAAGVVQGAGQLYGTAGNLFGTAGQLGASQASAITSAGGLYGQAASIENQYLSTLRSAYGDLSSANSAATSFFSNLIGTLSRGGGGGGSAGGVKSSSPTWVKSSTDRDRSLPGDSWTTTWMNTKTGQQVAGDGLFNPNNG